MSGGGISVGPAEQQPAPAPPLEGAGARDESRWRKYAVALAFLAPALFFLGVWVLYPTVYTVIRSLYDRTGDQFVGVDNYVTLFTTNVLLTAIKNNVIWVLVVPALVTAIGLVFAVLTERVSWSVAFKTAVFMPMAISLFAAGVIWRIMYEQDPSRGTINAAVAAVDNVVNPSGGLAGARPSTGDIRGSASSGYELRQEVRPGDVALLGLTRIATSRVDEGAVPATSPAARTGAITGVVWRDFSPGGGEAGAIDPEELGLPNVRVVLSGTNGEPVDTLTESDGSFAFTDLPEGTFRVGLAAENFTEPFRGVSWLSARLITPAIIIAYIWVWAGFSMVVIGSGLAAIPRDVMEAARTDGASEWQVFRRVTVPLLAPVLSVVFITMAINVLKVFDIVLSVAPGSVQDDANVIALAMWRTSFGGVNDFGLGSAIAVFLFILVVPVLMLNIRRFRREAS